MPKKTELINEVIDIILSVREYKAKSIIKLTYSYNDINKIHAELFKPLLPNEITKLKSKLTAEEIKAIDNYLLSHRINEERPNIYSWGKPRFLYNIINGYETRLRNNENPTALANLIDRVTAQGEETKYNTTYSGLEKSDYQNVENTLKKHTAETFKNKSDKEIAKKVSMIYQELDYLHARWDGNSRSNRTYLSILGNESNFKIFWNKIDRQELYLARDKALAEKTMARNPQEKATAATTAYIIESIEEINHKSYALKDVIKPFIATNLKEKINYKISKKQKEYSKKSPRRR